MDLRRLAAQGGGMVFGPSAIEGIEDEFLENMWLNESIMPSSGAALPPLSELLLLR